MQYNDFGIDFKYLMVNEKDRKFGITVNTVGFQPVQPDTNYPSPDHPKSYYFKPSRGRVLSEYQLIYITKGKGVFSSETTKKRVIEKGSVIVLFPGQWHTYCPDVATGWNEYYIGFEGSVIDEIVKCGFISPNNQIIEVGINEDLVNLYSNAIRAGKKEEKSSQQFLGGITLHILGLILLAADNKNLEDNDNSQIIERAKIIMTENVMRKIDIKEIAENLGTSYSWFRKAFKNHTGYSPAQYFQELKLKKAKELLAETQLPIKEIVYDLDFSSYDYFFSFFKRRSGYTPSEYRDLGKVPKR